MLVKVCAELGGRGRDGTMKVVGWWWERDGVEWRKEKEGRGASSCLSLEG